MPINASLFDDPKNSVVAEWVGMPEYNNQIIAEPFITATFKFRNQEDFDRFNEHLRETIYNGERVFDGMQRKTVKSAWYPLKEKARKYRYR